MKEYEKAYDIKLPKRMPIILRIDGRSFHQVLKNAEKPFDKDVKTFMDSVAVALVDEVGGAVFAYVQSDEVNLLVINYSTLEFEPYFNNELQKIVSVTASIATREFNSMIDTYKNKAKILYGTFDSRAFVLPKEEVCNLFLWRQQDCERNSVQMVARSLYTHKQCENKNNSQLQDMMFKKGINWNSLPVWQKRGRAVYRKAYTENRVLKSRIIIDDEIPVFSEDREFIDRFVNVQNGK